MSRAASHLANAFLCAACAAGALAFTLMAAARLSFPYALNYSEDSILVMVAGLLNGEGLYDARYFSGVPAYLAPYPPLYYFIIAGMTAATGELTMTSGRVVSIVSVLGTAACIGAVVQHAARDRFAATIAGLGFLGMYPVLFWGSLHRVDAFAALCVIAALSVWVRYGATRRSLVVTGALFTCAVLTKHSYLAGLAACIIVLRRESFGKAVALGGAVVGVFMLVFGVVYATSDGGVWFAMIISLVNPFDEVRFRNLIGQFVPSPLVVMWGLVIIAVAMRGGFGTLRSFFQVDAAEDVSRADRGRATVFVFLCLASAQALLSVGKEGSAINYFYEVSAAILLAGGIAFAHFRCASQRSAAAAVTVMLALATALHVYFQTEMLMWNYNLVAARGTLAFDYFADDWIQRLAPPGALVLTDVPAVPLLAGRTPATNDPYTFTLLHRQGVWDDAPVVEALRTGEIALVMNEGEITPDAPARRLTPAMSSTILERYRYVGTTNGYYFYVPR